MPRRWRRRERKRGRRTLAYSATAAADDYFPKAYGELTNELLGYVGDTDPELLEDLFAKRRQHRIENAQVRLAGKRTLGTKVAELTRILDEDGYLATYEKVASGVYRVIEHNCAIWAVAQRYGQACTSELDFIRASLPEAQIEGSSTWSPAPATAPTRSEPAPRRDQRKGVTGRWDPSRYCTSQPMRWSLDVRAMSTTRVATRRPSHQVGGGEHEESRRGVGITGLACRQSVPVGSQYLGTPRIVDAQA